MGENNSAFRVGIVSALNTDDKTVRVFFPDLDDMVSGWLFVLQRPGEAISTSTDGSHNHDENVPSGGAHGHTGTVGSFMPKVNDRVLVCYPSGYNMSGYILGVIP